MDSAFKAETELNFVNELQSCPNVTYLSATPYIEEYLDELDEFKNLPYYELKWDSSHLRTIDVEFKKTTSISREVDKIINNYGRALPGIYSYTVYSLLILKIVYLCLNSFKFNYG